MHKHRKREMDKARTRLACCNVGESFDAPRALQNYIHFISRQQKVFIKTKKKNALEITVTKTELGS